MKFKLLCIAFLGITSSVFGQNNRILIDGYTSVKLGDFDYLQSGARILVTIPTKVDWLTITSESFVLDQGFAQSLVGTEFKMSESLFVSTLIGIANNPDNPLRLGTSALLINKKTEGLLVYQWGPKSSYFYIAKWAFKIKDFGVGLRAQRFLNTGLYLDSKINKKMTIWTQIGKDLEFDHSSIALGLTGKF